MTTSRSLHVHRGGVTLVELMVALVLGGLVVASVAGTLRQQLVSQRQREARQGGREASRDGADAIATDLRAAIAPVSVGDTAVEMLRLIGGGATCAPMASGDLSVVVPAVTEHAAAATSWWRVRPRAGDTIWVWRDSSWWGAPVASVSAGPNGCSPLTSTPVATLRLTLSIGWEGPDVLPSATAIRVARRTRWVVYRSSDGSYQLGLRERAPGRWDAVQPVVGPLLRTGGLAARQNGRGWQITVRAHSGDTATTFVLARNQ